MNRAPFGSNFNSPQLQQALASLAQVEAPAIPKPQAAGAAHGSNLSDPHLQQAASSLMQSQGEDVISIQTVKNSLNGGELSPDMECRFDIPRYQNGCEKLLNMIPLASGGITKRPGFRHVLSIGNAGGNYAGQARLFPFVYSSRLAWMWVLKWDAASGTCVLESISRDGTGGARVIANLPFEGNEIYEVSMCQVGAVVYFAHPSHAPFKLRLDDRATGALVSTEPEYLDFKIHMDSPTITHHWWWGTSEGTQDDYYVATAVNKDTGEESLPSEVYKAAAHQYFITGCAVEVFVEPMENVSEYRIYKRKGGAFGFIGRITGSHIDPFGEEKWSFRDDNIAPDMADAPPEQFGGFAGPGDYPSLVFMHQQRLGFAASDNDPLTIWMSQTSNFECMAARTPPMDDDAIEVTLASTQANRILWAVPDRSGLAIGTEGGEWYMTGASGETALSPNSISFQPQTNYGSEENVKPVRCASSLLFCQRGGKQIRDMGYSFQSDRYEAQDLTLLARHLFRFAKVKSWAWQDAPASILWICLHSGQLLGLTYLPEHEVTAWHKHESPNARFIDCAVLQDSTGRYRLWAVILRNSGGAMKYSVEIMEPVYEGQPDEWDEGISSVALPAHRDGIDDVEYQARCIPCLPEIGLQAGSSAFRVRRISGIKARVINSKPFRYQVKSQNTGNSRIVDVPFNGGGYVEQADWACPIDAGFREGARLELIFDGDAPITLLGLSIQMDLASETGGQK